MLILGVVVVEMTMTASVEDLSKCSRVLLALRQSLRQSQNEESEHVHIARMKILIRLDEK